MSDSEHRLVEHKPKEILPSLISMTLKAQDLKGNWRKLSSSSFPTKLVFMWVTIAFLVLIVSSFSYYSNFTSDKSTSVKDEYISLVDNYNIPEDEQWKVDRIVEEMGLHNNVTINTLFLLAVATFCGILGGLVSFILYYYEFFFKNGYNAVASDFLSVDLILLECESGSDEKNESKKNERLLLLRRLLYECEEKYLRSVSFSLEAKSFVHAYVIVGVVASYIVPLFLHLIGSHHIRETKTDSTIFLVVGGFCLLAAVYSKSFIKSMADKSIFDTLKNIEGRQGKYMVDTDAKFMEAKEKMAEAELGMSNTIKEFEDKVASNNEVIDRLTEELNLRNQEMNENRHKISLLTARQCFDKYWNMRVNLLQDLPELKAKGSKEIAEALVAKHGVELLEVELKKAYSEIQLALSFKRNAETCVVYANVASAIGRVLRDDPREMIEHGLSMLEDAIKDSEKLEDFKNYGGFIYWNAACYISLLQRPEHKKACGYLKKAIEYAPDFNDDLKSDEDLGYLRNTDEYKVEFA